MRGVAIAVAGLAVCFHMQGEEAVAARLFGLADWVASENRVQVWPPPEERDYAVMVGATRDALGGQDFAHATVEGEAITIEEAIELVAGKAGRRNPAAPAGQAAQP
jgi:hypothetical protein